MPNNLITIMIADDESSIRSGLTQIVSDERFFTHIIGEADNGRDALHLVRKHQPDLAIMDIKMPELDGLEVIRQAQEEGCKTRFLILSGYNDFSYAQKAIRYHAKAYFLKPLNIVEFKDYLAGECEEILKERASQNGISPRELDSLLYSSRYSFLNQLIRNELHDLDEISRRIHMLNLELREGSCCVVIYHITESLDENNIDLSQVNEDCIRRSYPQFNHESWVYENGRILSVLNLKDTRGKEFRSCIRACLAKIKELFHLDAQAAVGDAAPGLVQCSYSYLRAQQALSYRIYEQGAAVFDSSVICEENPDFDPSNIRLQPLAEHILACNADGIKAYCEDFFHSLFFVRTPPPNFIRGMCMYLIINIQKEIALMSPGSAVEYPFSFKEMDNLSSIPMLKKWMAGFFMGYSSKIAGKKNADNEIIAKAKEYIGCHLNTNPKAKDVAALVNFSESYFLTYFKEKTGINFRDYVLSLKIDYAKSRMRDGDSSISEIAFLTGYQDYRSFSRAFKNETGMSPSEYMNSLK